MKSLSQLSPSNSFKSLPRPTTPSFLRRLKLIFRPIDYLEDYGKQFGDFIVIGNSETPFVYVNHPDAIQQIFTAKPEIFETGRGNGILRYLLGENSILLLDGVSHRQQRKLLMPPFHGERLQTYSHLIYQITQEILQEWKVGKSLLIRSEMQKITLKVILQVVFGLQQGKRYDELQKLLTILLDSISSPLSSSLLFFTSLQKDWGKWSPWGRFLDLKSQVDQLLIAEIEERRSTGTLSGEDILTLLMCTTDEDGEPMTVAQLKDQLMTLLVAGHETTASALTWAIYWIHYQENIQEKLRLDLPKSDDNNFLEKAIKSSYLEAICQETLRIYPITLSTFPRILKEPLEIMGYEFPARTVLMPSVYLVHHREDIYPKSYQFKPERFLEKQFSPYEYLPFGGGNRYCIGNGLAMLEMKIVLATILSQLQLKLINPRPLKPIRRGLTVAPPNNLKIKIMG